MEPSLGTVRRIDMNTWKTVQCLMGHITPLREKSAPRQSAKFQNCSTFLPVIPTPPPPTPPHPPKKGEEMKREKKRKESTHFCGRLWRLCTMLQRINYTLYQTFGSVTLVWVIEHSISMSATHLQTLFLLKQFYTSRCLVQVTLYCPICRD